MRENMEHLRDNTSSTFTQHTHLTIDSTIQHHQLHNDSSRTPLLLPQSHFNLGEQKLLIAGNLSKIRQGLKWLALDHSSLAAQAISVFAFVILVIFVPAVNVLLDIDAPVPDFAAGVNFHKLAQLPDSALAAIAFVSLSRFFLDDSGIEEDSAYVQYGYARELDRAVKYIAGIILPAFTVELAHKIIFFSTVSTKLPAVSDRLPGNLFMLMAGLASWVYRTGVFLLVCVLFRMTCELHILRLEGFKRRMEVEFEMDPLTIFNEHARIKDQLSVTSHRYRIFIIGCLITVTVTQLGALFMEFASKSPNNFFNAGDLIVCSVVQLSGFCLCLMGAARITHRAQGIAAIASRWHVAVTCKIDEHESIKEPKLPSVRTEDSIPSGDYPGLQRLSFEARHALVSYLQNNHGGITLFGYALDRGMLHTLFAFETSLVLWILSKVIVI